MNPEETKLLRYIAIEYAIKTFSKLRDAEISPVIL